MRSSRLLLAIVTVFAFFTMAAPQAYAETADEELYVPTSGWLVGPAFLAKPEGFDDIELPCVMANQFSNGYIFRFSGGNEVIMAMAIDFRQSLFEPGKVYDIGVALLPNAESAVYEGTSYDEATLIVNMQGKTEFYNFLKSGKTLRVDISGQTLDFALLGVKNGLQRMEGCFNPEKQQPQHASNRQSMSMGGMEMAAIQSVQSMQNPSIPPTRSMTITEVEDEQVEPMQTATAIPMVNQNVQTQPQSVQTMEMASAPSVPDSNKNFSNDRSELEKTMTVLRNTKAKQVAQQMAALEPAAGDARIARANNQAVDSGAKAAQPVQSYGVPLANTWLQKAMQPPKPPKSQSYHHGQDRTVPLELVDYVPSSYSPAEYQKEANMQKQWRAMKGSNVRDLLDIWATNSKARLVWNANQDYALKESISIKGDLKTAVSLLLGTFKDEKIRPVGKVYSDPSTGQRILLIETAGAY